MFFLPKCLDLPLVLLNFLFGDGSVQRSELGELTFLLFKRLRLQLNMTLFDLFVEGFGLHQRAQRPILRLRFLLPPALDLI